MKWLAAFLCLLAMPALAEEPVQQNNMQNLAIGVQCRPDSPDVMLREQFGEIPMLVAPGIVLGAAGQRLPGELKMYVNPETKTYSIEFSVNNELYCIVMTGSNLGPAIQGRQL